MDSWKTILTFWGPVTFQWRTVKLRGCTTNKQTTVMAKPYICPGCLSLYATIKNKQVSFSHWVWFFYICLELVAFQNWNKKISFLFANNHNHDTTRRPRFLGRHKLRIPTGRERFSFSEKKREPKRKAISQFFFGGHEPLHCNFTQVFMNGKIAEKVLIFF